MKDIHRRLILVISLVVVTCLRGVADSLFISPFDIIAGESSSATIDISLSQPIVGFQGELILPEGLDLEKQNGEWLSLTEDLAVSHSLIVNRDDNGIVKFICFSNENAIINQSIAVMQIQIVSSDKFRGGEIVIDNTIFSGESNTEIPIDRTECDVNCIVPVSEITLSEYNVSLYIGEKLKISASILPSDATYQNITWKSSDKSIVAVDADGVVTALSAGEATITASASNGKSASCRVTVSARVVEVTGVTLSHTELSLTEGESAMLTATVAPDDASDKTVTWISADESVAVVDIDGNITAIGVGQTVITAVCGGVSATCKVTVIPILIESITIDPTVWEAEEGSEFRITVAILPENATYKALEYKSSDSSIATVDAEGNVKVLKTGSCVITVSTLDGSSITAECVITALSGIDTIFEDDAIVDVFSINGVKLKHACTCEELKQLKSGVYILRSGHKVVKVVINN